MALNRLNGITKDTSARMPITTPKLDYIDRRILITILKSARFNKLVPFSLKRALVDRIEGLALAIIPGLLFTKTG